MSNPAQQNAAASVWKAETKFQLANERTLIAWLRVASTMGIGGLLAGLAHASAAWLEFWRVFGIAQAAAAVLVAAYAYKQHRHRSKLVAKRHHGNFDEAYGPGLVALAVAAGLTCDLGSLVHQSFAPAVGCAVLPLPLVLNASGPFLYITFHGTDSHLHSCASGVGGVHRFSLDGDYAGPATDQAAARMYHPRGLVHINGNLVVTESRDVDSSLSVFGRCSPSSPVRAFLGHIRPPDALKGRFEHPYGITASDETNLDVSAQNGGAVVGIDMLSAHMTLRRQVAPARKAGSRKSGALRGITITPDGCEHVADKHASLLHHFCPDKPPAATKVPNPISVLYDIGSSALFVSSLGDEKRGVSPAVYAFSFDNGNSTLLRMYVAHIMHHPTGLLVHRSELIVIEQTQRAVVVFDLASAAFLRVAISALPDAPEALLLSNDC